jgi:hypothetical protein
MANLKYQTLSLPDSKAIDAFSDLWDALGASRDATYSITLFDSGSGPTTVTGKMAELASSSTVEAMRESGVVVFRSMGLTGRDPESFSVTLSRPKVKESPTDEIDLHVNDGISMERKAAIVVAVRTAFRQFDFPAEVDKTLGPALSQFYARREEGLTRLEELSHRLIEQNEGYRRSLDLETAKARARMEESFAQRESALRTEYTELKAELANREAALAAEKKDLDDRSSRHARRQLAEDLKEILRNRAASFALSKATNDKRLPIHVLFGVLIVVTGGVAGHALFKTNVDQSWTAFAKFAVATLSTIGAIAFYIRWNDSWAREHANEEFKMRRLDVDIDRASWVVEVALEWRDEKGSQIPPELLDRLSASLFTDASELRRATHPAEDAFSALFGASTGLKLHIPGGGELAYDRKGIQRLEKELPKA